MRKEERELFVTYDRSIENSRRCNSRLSDDCLERFEVYESFLREEVSSVDR